MIRRNSSFFLVLACAALFALPGCAPKKQATAPPPTPATPQGEMFTVQPRTTAKPPNYPAGFPLLEGWRPVKVDRSRYADEFRAATSCLLVYDMPPEQFASLLKQKLDQSGCRYRLETEDSPGGAVVVFYAWPSSGPVQASVMQFSEGQTLLLVGVPAEQQQQPPPKTGH
jgi:hypothetical protein